MIITTDFIKQLVNDYRNAEKTDDWDDFGEIYGDIDNFCDTLIMIIEDKLL